MVNLFALRTKCTLSPKHLELRQSSAVHLSVSESVKDGLHSDEYVKTQHLVIGGTEQGRVHGLQEQSLQENGEWRRKMTQELAVLSSRWPKSEECGGLGML